MFELKKIILNYKIKKCIKQHHNILLYEYFKINTTTKTFQKIIIFLLWNIELKVTLYNVHNTKKINN